MLYLVIELFFLFVPGLILFDLLGLRQYRFLVSLSLSLSLLAITVSTLRSLQVAHANLTWLAGIEVLILVLLLVWKRRLALRWTLQNFSLLPSIVKESLQYDRRRSLLTTGALITLVTITTYLLFVGPYTEVPADAWRHLEKTEFVVERSKGTDIFLYPLAWYSLQAWFRLIGGLSVEQYINYATFLHTALFVVGFYFFVLYVVKTERVSRGNKVAISLLATIFCVLHFGVNVFSFVRYYAFGPVILNYLIFLACVCLIAEYIRKPQAPVQYIGVVAVFLVAMFILHLQEVAFTFVMTIAILIVNFFMRQSRSVQQEVHGAGLAAALHRNRPGVLLALGLTLFLSLFLYSRYNLDVQGRLEPWVVPLSTYLPFVRNLYIANPTGHVYEALTAWGLFVYIVFIFQWSKERRNLVLMAGMITPLVSLFNPVFVDIFIRHYRPEGIYRFAYVVPLAIAAATVFFYSGQRLLRRTGNWNRLAYLVPITGLVLLLLPIQTSYIVSPYSRISTLRAVAQENNYTHWKDLFLFLERLERRHNVLTDPITGYMLTALTKHHSSRWKFHRTWYHKINFDSYDRETFSRFSGWLLVVNRRDGQESWNGKISRHWQSDILRLSDYYSEGLLLHLAQNPDLFAPIWSNNSIVVYKILG